MARKRSASEEPRPQPNPFWSTKAALDFDVRMARPDHLPAEQSPEMLPPVPSDDWEGEDGKDPVQDPLGNGELTEEMVGGRARAWSRRGKGGSVAEFRTPPSGSQKMDEKSFERVSKMKPVMTEGPMPWRDETSTRSAVGSGAPVGTGAQQSLEAALGEEITMQLWREVEQLRAELKEARESKGKGGSGTSWSEVSLPAEETMEPRTPRTTKKVDLHRQKDLRWTPNGTQVPLGSPPDEGGEDQQGPPPPPLPPLPDLRWYEADGDYEKRRIKARFDDTTWLPRGALRSEYWSMPVHRYAQEGEVTASSRQQQFRDLDHGRMSLDQAHLSMDRGDVRALHPHHAVPGNHRALHGTSEDQPGVRALHGNSEDRQGVRALHGTSEDQPGVRALHGNSEDRQGVRAWQGTSDVRCGVRALYGTSEGRHGDRAQQWSHVQYGDSRACTLDPECQSDDLGMRYHGQGQGHQQLPNFPGSDPKGEDGTGLVRGRERSPHDALRANNPVLPKLPQYGTKTSSVDAADWIIEIQPIIGDMSNKATKWWTLTMQSTMKTYEKWLAATPLERLRLPPPDPVHPMMVGGDPMAVQRLEQRITTLLLPAIPDELRQDLVANRELWPSAIMYKVLRTFQPGGWSERSSLLAELTQVAVAKDPVQAANGLRLWKRQRARAIELGAGLPDLMLQVRALDSVVSKILPQHPQALFRVSSFRMETHIDERPTTESLLQFHELLQAEVDTLVHSTPGSGGADKPATKALQLSPQQGDKGGKPGQNSTTTTSPDKVKPCRFWGSADGCRHAKQCRFGHAALPDARERCWLCSAKDHRKSDCPYAKESAGSQAGGSGGSGRAGKGEMGKSESGKGKGGNGKTATPSTSGEGNGRDQEQGGDPKLAAVGSTNDSNGESKASTGGSGDTNGEPTKKETELMTEVTSLLRSLRAAVKMCSIKRLSKDEEEVVLLDGGATHCLRTCESELEWSSAKDIKVSLAEGETTMKQLPDARTLITKERVQPIVPVSMVAVLGYKITWNSDGCTIQHPERGTLPVTLVQGCPTVPSKVGRMLMREVEEWHKQQCWVKSILTGEEKGHSMLHQRLEALRNLFPEVPSHLLQQVPGKLDWHGSRVPLSRRQRRSIEKAKTLVIYAFSGPDYKDWVTVESKGSQ